MNKGSNSTGSIDCSKWIKRKFTTSSMDKQRVVMETYRMLKKVGYFGVEYEQNKVADWVSGLKEETVKLEQQNVVINEDKVKKQSSKMPNWKAPGHDGVQGFRIKTFDKMHERIASQLNEILEGMKEITFGRTVLCPKDPVKGNSGELQTNNLSTTYVEITYRYYFRGYVLFHGK